MRIALIGQAQFGMRVFEALREVGEDVVAVSSVKGKPDRPDPLWQAAETAGVPLFPTGQLKKPDVLDAYAATKPDLGVMAFVTHILPERVLELPARGTIQYHPSLLPKHRGINAMHWAIRQGETRTGLTIFWVDKGIDTGPILLQREVAIGPDDRVGSLYFDKLFNLGVETLVESVRLVREGKAPRIPQDESQATYEPPVDDANSAIDWSKPGQEIYNLIRGSNPTPGAHAVLKGQRVRIYDSRFTPDPNDQTPVGGEIPAVEDDRIDIVVPGGVLHAKRLQHEGGEKLAAPAFAREMGIEAGDAFEPGLVE